MSPLRPSRSCATGPGWVYNRKALGGSFSINVWHPWTVDNSSSAAPCRCTNSCCLFSKKHSANALRWHGGTRPLVRTPSRCLPGECVMESLSCISAAGSFCGRLAQNHPLSLAMGTPARQPGGTRAHQHAEVGAFGQHSGSCRSHLVRLERAAAQRFSAGPPVRQTAAAAARQEPRWWQLCRHPGLGRGSASPGLKAGCHWVSRREEGRGSRGRGTARLKRRRHEPRPAPRKSRARMHGGRLRRSLPAVRIEGRGSVRWSFRLKGRGMEVQGRAWLGRGAGTRWTPAYPGIPELPHRGHILPLHAELHLHVLDSIHIRLVCGPQLPP